MPNQTPAEAEGRISLLSDPAAPTRVEPGDPLAAGPQTPDGQTTPHGAGPQAPGGETTPHRAGWQAPGGETTPHAAAQHVAGGETWPQGAGQHVGGDQSMPHRAGWQASGGAKPADGAAQPYGSGDATSRVAPYPPFSAGEPQPGAPYSVRDPAAPEQGPVADLPPGLDPDELAAAPASSARRGRLRKRVAFLRAARELLLRDLGGFIYEIHRTAGDIEHAAHRRLRATKLDRLTRIDAELHELELRLDDVRRNVVVREPGVGGECPECGELFGSDAHYCSHCGLPLTESARRAIARAAAAAAEQVPAEAAAAAAAEPVPVEAAAAAAAEPVPAEAAAAAAADQPTQEIPALERQAAEFHWPQREATPATAVAGRVWSRHDAVRPDDAAGAGAATAGGDAAAGDETSGESRGEATAGDETATADDEPRGAATAGDDAPAADDEPRGAATAGDDAPAADDEPRGAASAGDDAPAADDEPRRDATAGDETATADGEPRGDATAGGDATATGDMAAGGPAPPADGDAVSGERAASGGQDAPAADGPTDPPNGRAPESGDHFSRMERGT